MTTLNRNIVLSILTVIFALPPAYAQEPLPQPLTLPPGLEELLPIDKSSSYLMDAFRLVNCPDDKDNPYGTCGSDLFGGLAIAASHLSGVVRIKFSQPVGSISHFEVTHPGGLAGDDTVLKAPQFYQFPLKSFSVRDDSTLVSSGDLDLTTGEVTNLSYFFLFSNSGLTAIGKANPNLVAPVVNYPGIYGSAWASFEQRSDGLLNYSFSGSAFLPLGNKIGSEIVRMPLPVCDADLNCATIPAPGTSLHPHLSVSTKAPEGPACGDTCPDIPTNAIQVLTTFSRNTSFGDKFTLNIPQLGGPALGRSELHGRIQIQFGEKTGNAVPFAVSSLPPEGFLATPPKTPLSIPGVSIGLIGHNEYLVFPDLKYFLQDVAFADDPFDITLGMIDLQTGKVIGNLLYRGFIAQDLLFTLLAQNDGRIAPSSFYFRGPAFFDKDPHGQTVFHFDGTTHVSFTGFTFPAPDHVREHAFVAGPGSFLDPFLRIQAIHPAVPPAGTRAGSGSAVASTGDQFSYGYSIPCEPAGEEATFEYSNMNADKGGTFKLQRLGAVRCVKSRSSEAPEGQSDTVSFTAFGSWSTDQNIHLATVQISSSPQEPYVSIQIDGGLVSNVNTRPPELLPAAPTAGPDSAGGIGKQGPSVPLQPGRRRIRGRT